LIYAGKSVLNVQLNAKNTTWNIAAIVLKFAEDVKKPAARMRRKKISGKTKKSLISGEINYIG
jgi:hypothetical protein